MVTWSQPISWRGFGPICDHRDHYCDHLGKILRRERPSLKRRFPKHVTTVTTKNSLSKCTLLGSDNAELIGTGRCECGHRCCPSGHNVGEPGRDRGRLPICSKSYAKRPFRSCLPLGSVLKEGFERKKPRIHRSAVIRPQRKVCESKLISFGFGLAYDFEQIGRRPQLGWKVTGITEGRMVLRKSRDHSIRDHSEDAPFQNS